MIKIGNWIGSSSKVDRWLSLEVYADKYPLVGLSVKPWICLLKGFANTVNKDELYNCASF